jgi:hypothetical protein
VRRLLTGFALLVFGITLNQISGMFDFRPGIAAAVGPAVIGYGLARTSVPVKHWPRRR